MNAEYGQLAQKAQWYRSEQLDIDKKVIGFRYEAVKPYLLGPSLLELGPAEGIMTRRFAEDFEKLTVVDAVPELLNLIPNFSNISKVCSIFEEFNPRERFNTIVMDHVLEHVEDPTALLRRAKGWLNPNGRIVVGVPNGHSIHRLVAVKMSLLKNPCELNERDLTLGHRRVYIKESLTRDILAANLEIIKIGGVFFKPLAYSQIQEHWTDGMIQGFLELGKDFPDYCAEIFAVCESS